MTAKKLATFALATLFLAASATASWNVYSQEAGQPPKARAKPRGRLPSYYGDVVSLDQREKIYSIQSKYEVELAALREQLKALVAKRDAEVEAVLSDEQKEQVKKLAAEAKAEREAELKLRAAEAAGTPAAEVQPSE